MLQVKQSSPLLAIAAAGAGGFFLGGPVGALVGAGVGYFIGRSKGQTVAAQIAAFYGY